MLDPAYIRDHIDEVRAGLRNRGLDPDKALEEIATLETARRRIIPELEGLKRQQNTSGDEIARAKRQGHDTAPVQEANRARAQQIKQLGLQLDSIEHQREHGAPRRCRICRTQSCRSARPPPTTSRSGATASRARSISSRSRTGISARRSASSTSSAATKIAGARFSVLSGAGARLSRALINFMLDLHTREHGYREIEPPFLVNARVAARHRQPAEVRSGSVQDRRRLGSVSGADRGSAADQSASRRDPRRPRAADPLHRLHALFRSEAGSYGQDVRGLIRQHQFDKVELVKLTTPEQSYDGARIADAQRRGSAEAARAAVPHDAAVHRRHGLRVGEDLRHRGVAAEPEDVPRDLVLQQHRGVPGAPREHQVPRRRHRQGGVRAHA